MTLKQYVPYSNKEFIYYVLFFLGGADIASYSILQIFPFTSESKRMGIILKDEKTNEILFYMKGADVVMASIVQFNDWLEEEVDNMAREGKYFL